MCFAILCIFLNNALIYGIVGLCTGRNMGSHFIYFKTVSFTTSDVYWIAWLSCFTWNPERYQIYFFVEFMVYSKTFNKACSVEKCVIFEILQSMILLDLTSESQLLATSGTTGCAPMYTTNEIQQETTSHIGVSHSYLTFQKQLPYSSNGRSCDTQRETMSSVERHTTYISTD